MKQRRLSILVVLSICMVWGLLSSGCDLSPRSKALVIVNDSANAIDYVAIRQYVSGAKMAYPNALANGETIAAGESKRFYLAPYGDNTVYVAVDDDALGSASVSFTYDYLVDGLNRSITATYSGTEISVSGSNAQLPV